MFNIWKFSIHEAATTELAQKKTKGIEGGNEQNLQLGDMDRMKKKKIIMADVYTWRKRLM